MFQILSYSEMLVMFISAALLVELCLRGTERLLPAAWLRAGCADRAAICVASCRYIWPRAVTSGSATSGLVPLSWCHGDRSGARSR